MIQNDCRKYILTMTDSDKGDGNDLNLPPPNSSLNKLGHLIHYPCLQNSDDHEHAFPFSLERTDNFRNFGRLRIKSTEVVLVIEQPDFSLCNKRDLKKYWAGLDIVSRTIETLINVKKLSINHFSPGVSIRAPVSFAADMRCEAMLLCNVRKIEELSWYISPAFEQVSYLNAFSSSLKNHLFLEEISLNEGDFIKSAHGGQAFLDAILSLPKLAGFSAYELFSANQMADYVCKTAISKLHLSMNYCLTNSDSLLTVLGSSQVTLDALEILDDEYHPFGGRNGLGELARKLAQALNTNISLRELNFEPGDNDISWNQNHTDAERDTEQSQQESGMLLGQSIAKHPSLEQVMLNFGWHSEFFMQVLAGASKSQRLTRVNLKYFAGTEEQCSCLVQLLQNDCLSSLSVSDLMHPIAFLHSLSNCILTNLKTLYLDVDWQSNGSAALCGRSILVDLGKLLHHNITCVNELTVKCFCKCGFSDFTDFLIALKDTNVSRCSVAFCFRRDGKGNYRAKYLHAIKSNVTLTFLQNSDLDSDNDSSPILSSDTTELGRGIMRMNEAGRRYILTEPTNKPKGINVLSSVQSDLNCLFLHLLENSFLCFRRHARAENASSCLGEAKTRKRKSNQE